MRHPLAPTRLRLRRTARITVSWVLVACVVALFERNVLASHGVEAGWRERIDAHFLRSLLAGLLGGGVYIFLLRDRLRRHPFFTAWAMMAAMILPVVAFTGAWLPAQGSGGMNGGAGFAERLFSLRFLGDYLYWTLLMGATMLMVRLNDQYGNGGIAWLTGRYHRPRQEMRIFMFLDMRSSTTIAERIGHVRYFELLNALYTDITDPIMYSRGEIYQYVGDEISVSWPLRRGIKRQRCIRCFLDIREKMQARARHYQERFGIVPTFKAGFHYGPVTTGEVGLVKRERIYSGDVVNTAARIQNTCNTHGVDNLLSQELVEVMHLDRVLRLRKIGSITLRGKRQPMVLFTIEHDDPAPATPTPVAEVAQKA